MKGRGADNRKWAEACATAAHGPVLQLFGRYVWFKNTMPHSRQPGTATQWLALRVLTPCRPCMDIWATSLPTQQHGGTAQVCRACPLGQVCWGTVCACVRFCGFAVYPGSTLTGTQAHSARLVDTAYNRLLAGQGTHTCMLSPLRAGRSDTLCASALLLAGRTGMGDWGAQCATVRLALRCAFAFCR